MKNLFILRLQIDLQIIEAIYGNRANCIKTQTAAKIMTVAIALDCHRQRKGIHQHHNGSRYSIHLLTYSLLDSAIMQYL